MKWVQEGSKFSGSLILKLGNVKVARVYSSFFRFYVDVYLPTNDMNPIADFLKEDSATRFAERRVGSWLKHAKLQEIEK